MLVFFGGIYAALANTGAYAFVVYEIVYFLNPDNRWWSAGIPGLRYSFITVILMMFVLVRRYKEYSVISPWSEMPGMKWMIALVIMYYIAFSFAINMPVHSQFTIDFTKLVIIIFIAYKLINTKPMFDICLWVYLMGCSYIGYLAMGKGRNQQGRVEGIGMIDAPDANDTAAILVPAAVILMYFAWQGNKKIKVLAVLIGAFVANGLVLINSRGSFLGVVASLGIFLMFMIFSRHQKKGQKATAIFLIICGLSGALYMTDDMFWDRMGTLANTEDGKESGSSRVVFWITTFDMMEDHPFGMGVNGYNALASLYMDDETRGGVVNRAVHSSWFQGLSEVGWQGMFIFSGLLFSILSQSRQAKKFAIENKNYDVYFKILALECALIGYCVAATFINRFRAELLYWLFLYLAIAINLYYIQPNKEEKRISIHG